MISSMCINVIRSGTVFHCVLHGNYPSDLSDTVKLHVGGSDQTQTYIYPESLLNWLFPPIQYFNLKKYFKIMHPKLKKLLLP